MRFSQIYRFITTSNSPLYLTAYRSEDLTENYPAVKTLHFKILFQNSPFLMRPDAYILFTF